MVFTLGFGCACEKVCCAYVNTCMDACVSGSLNLFALLLLLFFFFFGNSFDQVKTVDHVCLHGVFDLFFAGKPNFSLDLQDTTGKSVLCSLVILYPLTRLRTGYNNAPKRKLLQQTQGNIIYMFVCMCMVGWLVGWLVVRQ